MLPEKNLFMFKNYLIKTVVFFIMIPWLSIAKENRFGGGMGVHFQYADIQTDYGEPEGLAWGLGGRFHFNIGQHFRIGTLGSTWQLSYHNPGLQGSYYELGYGGLTAEYLLPLLSGRIGLGVLVGGGVVTNLHVISKNSLDSISAVYKHFPTMIFSPMLTYEYPLTKIISVMGTLDYLMGNHLGNNQRTGSPGLRVCVIFNK